MAVQLSQQDLDLLARYPDVPIIDTSDRRSHRECLSRWDFTSRLRQGRQSISTAPALAFGTAIHEGLDVYYGEDQSKGALLRAFAAASLEADLDKEAYVLGRAMLEEYAEWAPPLDDFEVVMSEHAGLVPIYSGKTNYHDGNAEVVGLYYFRTDGIIRDEHGRLWIMEHKTTGEWWNPAMLALDDQITSYIWAEQQWFGEPIVGVLMNFLLKKPAKDPELLKSGLPTADRSKLTYVTAERYAAALARGIPRGDPTPAAQVAAFQELQDREHPTLRRSLVERSPYQVEQQGARILAEFLEMIRPDKPIYPTPTKACGWCDMRNACMVQEAGGDPSYLLEEYTEPRRPLLGLEGLDPHGTL